MHPVEWTDPDSLVIVLSDFNKGNLTHKLPKYRQFIKCPTREQNILDHCYTTVSGAYHAIPRAPLGQSDHIMVHLIPSYRQKLKLSKPASKEVRVVKWLYSEKLQNQFSANDCFCLEILNEIRRTCPLYCHTACTHFTHIVSGDTHTHTHTHAGVTTVECVLCLFPSWRPPPGTSRSSGRPAMRRPGTKSKCSVLTWSGSGPSSICSFCMFFFIVGVLWGEPGWTRENMQTPHRKAREQAPTCCTMRDLNPRPSCCEATMLCTVPPRVQTDYEL